jgi:hypothetical protein|tara:strand:- start:2553 stop:2744 length:192 start_codon:yes stop_codon:yes gene_type:complete
MTYLSAGYYWVSHISGNGSITVDGESYNLQASTGPFLIVVEQYASVNATEVKFLKVPKTVSIG